MSKKMLMLATTAAMIEQFNKNNILILEKMGYEVHVAGNFLVGNPISEEKLEAFKLWLEQHNGKWFHIPSTRKPTDMKNNVTAYRKVVELIRSYGYEFIHCHTPIGSVIGRIAAHVTHTKIIYTAHGFHFYKGAPLINWLLYYPVERFLSRWTDVLILINQEDYQRAKNTFHAKRTEYIPGIGIDLEKFKNGSIDKDEKRKSLGLNNGDVMLLSVGELIPRKNHEMVIRAISKLKNPSIKYFICGKGEIKEYLENLILTLNLQERVFLLGYRQDISELCQCADLYVFPSLQEGLPVALMEAIACRTPVVCSNIRGNTDLIKNQDYIFNTDDIEELCKCISMSIEKDNQNVVEENYKTLQRYDLKNVVEQMKEEYKIFGAEYIKDSVF